MRNSWCCICGQDIASLEHIHREMAFCPGCGSNARFRGLIYAVLKHVFKDTSQPLKTQIAKPDVSAIGVSDTPIYANLLEDKLGYTNTYYHKDPHLDLCDPASVAKFTGLSLIICSDVIEHTKDVPIVVLGNMLGMLRPGGIVVLSAPTYWMPESLEWYSGARSIQVVAQDHRYVVLWKTIRGVEYVDTSPVFHGGPGDVLEMRLLSHSGLLAAASSLGFEVETLEFDLEKGYEWPIRAEVPGLDAEMDGRILVLTKPSHSMRAVEPVS
jgi:SAM-dependent methyltransferase